MRRHYLTVGVIAALGSILVAAPCGTGSGPAARTFNPGALVIPMDNCFQKRDASTPNQSSPACNATRDDGVFDAYGVVYFLLKHGITVYWAIDGATPKTSVTGADVVVPSGPINKFNWSTGTTSAYATSAITYIGGPFIIDVNDKPTVESLLSTNIDFAPFKSAAIVDIHEVMTGFTAPQVRPLVGPPPKVAILFSYSANTSAGVMVGYAKAAGFDWACHGACSTAADCKAGGQCVANVCQDCAGGISTRDPTCTQSYVQTQFGIAAVNNGPGTVYDILCDKDFLPDYTVSPPDFSKATLLALGSPGPYKLLWAPHWETPKTSGSLGTQADPNAAIGTFPRTLADWLQCLADFVGAGNNIFAECHAMVTLEGGAGSSGTEYGLPVTRFQTTAGFKATNQTPQGTAPSFPFATTFLQPQHPNVQIGDFAYQDVTGSIEYVYPDRTSPAASVYLSGVNRLMTQAPAPTGGGCGTCPGNQICIGTTCTLPYDISATVNVTGTGNVAYLGGHNYAGQTAGTRIVLNTLFNLGFGCADPNTVCNTGKLGICATGHLKCAPSGGFQCVQDNQPIPEICGNGLDDDCDGIVDNGCTPTVCTPGQTRPCFTGAANCTENGNGTFTCLGTTNGCVDNHNGTFTCYDTAPAICRLGQETCSASGAWGACTGEVHPGPEVCNGKDDNCNGAVDEGSNCYPGYACTNGVCLPSVCGVEVNVCPTGFTCDTATAKCDAVSCPTAPCTAPGQVCMSGTCQDPCQGVVCGPGASCQGGACTGGACYSFGCPAGQICTSGACIADPCAAANCPTGTFCRSGDCVRSCVYVQCGTGQVCNRDGFCETPACNPTCVAGQVCQGSACVPDPACQNVPCGSGQVCRAGTCGDAPCTSVHCPVGTCVQDQCQGTLPPGQAPTARAKSGCGCGSAGGLEVLSLGLAALAFGARRRRPRRGAAPGRRPRGLVGLLAAVLLLGASGFGCGSSGNCHAGQTKCGGSCVDLGSDVANCGVCGHVCPAQWACSGSSCAFATGNPFLQSISPSTAGVGATTSLTLAGSGFASGASVRFTGAGLDVVLPLTVTSASSAQLASLDLTKATPGTAEVQVLNPNPSNPGGPLVSNAVMLTLEADAMLTTVDKGSVPQDAGATSLALTGDKFGSAIQATLTLVKQWDGTTVTGAAPVTLNTSYVDAQHATVSGLMPGTLAIGTYDLKVQNPGGNPSNALAFSINAGKPTLGAVSMSCAGTTMNATASGTYLYPTTVIDVTCVAGGCGTLSSIIVQAPACTTNSLAQCASSQVAVSQDLTGAPAGTYCAKAMNSGPLLSNGLPFCIATTGACPTTCSYTCP